MSAGLTRVVTFLRVRDSPRAVPIFRGLKQENVWIQGQQVPSQPGQHIETPAQENSLRRRKSLATGIENWAVLCKPSGYLSMEICSYYTGQ